MSFLTVEVTRRNVTTLANHDLLLREKTERQEGLGENVCLSNYSTATINHFTENYAQFKTATNEPSKSPTNIIVDDLISRTQNEN